MFDIILMIMFLRQRFWQMVMDNVIQKELYLWHFLRACNIPCRVHGFTIDKKIQKGAMTGFVYLMLQKSIFPSWVEINFENQVVTNWKLSFWIKPT